MRLDVKRFGNGYQLDASLVEVVDYVGGVGDGPEKPVQLRHDHDRLALFRGGKQSAPRGAAGKRLAGADSGIFELLGEVQALHRAVSSDALALRFES